MSNMIYRLLTISFFLISVPSWAVEPLKADNIPELLQPWADWVLHDHPNLACPIAYNGAQRQCHWPSQLSIDIQDKEATFSQIWQMAKPDWVILPGTAQANPRNTVWPQNVKVNQQLTVVTDRNGVPSIFLPQGQSTITGQFYWQHRPESLKIPANTGLVNLTIDEQVINIPELDQKGQLWLRQSGAQQNQETKEDSLEIRVYRRLIDDIPLQIITYLEINVAGRHREITLGPVTLDAQLPMSLKSRLPTRLEPDGKLRLQVRPGTWNITLRTRQLGQVQSLTLPKVEPPWVEEEIWVFESRNILRLVEIQGATNIDPQQTSLPRDWRQFPTYLVKRGDILNFVEKRRGDPEPAPDQLTLHRDFWLDFDGEGYSVQDRITGTMTRGWRLEMNTPALLGRVSINNANQFITQLADSDKTGVEVRRGWLELVADSRLEQSVDELPAVGWEHNFQHVSATLHLPPGWRLFDANGVDNIPGTWLERWSLLDLFIVLIIAIAISKMFSFSWGIISLIALVICYHRVEGLQFVWLNLLAAIALLRVLPALGWFSRVVKFYRNAALIVMLVVVIPFMVQQAREVFFPQLEKPYQRLGDNQIYHSSQSISDSVANFNEVDEEVRLESAVRSPSSYGGYKQKVKLSKKLAQIDPNAQVQTGQGLPQWEWHNVEMQWSGPVNADQQINLYLLSPLMNNILGILRIAFLAILATFLLFVSWRRTT